MRELDIVIVNWNAGARLAQVLDSIAKYHHGLVAAVIVVDNGSTDRSLDSVSSFSGSLAFEVKVVRNLENRGFAVACNQGASCGSSPYILFLNPDTRIFDSSLVEALKCLQSGEKDAIGIVGVQLVDDGGRVSRSCSRFPSLMGFAAQAIGINRLPIFRGLSQAMDEWDHARSSKVDQVMGAFFLVGRSLFGALHGFDERFFVYFEEVDFARRALDLGWSSYYLSVTQIYHEGGGTSRKVKPLRLFYSLRSRVLYGAKHFRRWEAWLLVVITVLIEPVSRIVLALAKGDGVRDTLRGYALLFRNLAVIVQQVRQQ